LSQHASDIVGLRSANPTYENLLTDCIWLRQALPRRSGEQSVTRQNSLKGTSYEEEQ